MDKHILYLDFPAKEWELASPVGNGFSGAMVYGGVENECIQLSHERIWGGGKIDTRDSSFCSKLYTLRESLEVDPSTADELANELFDGSFHRIASNETAGDILMHTDISEYENYRRELDLYRGISKITFDSKGEHYCRETFASYPDKIICSNFIGKHSMTVRYSRRELTWDDYPVKLNTETDNFGVESVEINSNIMTVKAHPTQGGIPFFVKMKILTDGELSSDGRDFFVKNAYKTELFFTVDVGKEPIFPNFDYETLKARSVNDFFEIMNRAEINFKDEFHDMPVNKRLERLKSDENAVDSGLLGLYFDFGRYLLVSSSREGTLPAHLQGVWNTYTKAPWNSDYHTNINLQMNYWLAESCNLSDCALPLFDYMNEYLLESGRETARENYKCRGTVLHHLSDIYGFTAAADGVWGLWQLGGAWLCYSMWEHYLYSRDVDSLREKAYDYIHDSARFFLDYMFEKDGIMMTGPSTSPENHYYCNGKSVNICLTPTMDVEIIGGLLRFYIEIEDILHIDPSQADEARAALKKMPPLKIGKHGQVMEWLEDYDEPEPGHRHVSHLFALYPDNAINKDTPDLLKAAAATLERRLSNGGAHTGWSCAWITALYARLYDGESAVKMLRKLFTTSTLDNLLDTHPPFQIDGNFGATAAIVEMILQSQNGEIELFPACPEEYRPLSFRGIRARGNKTVSYTKDGGLKID